MWQCPKCGREFENDNQQHLCRESPQTVATGIPLKKVSYRAGHAQTSTTSNIYSHAIRTADEKAVEVIEEMIQHKVMEK